MIWSNPLPLDLVVSYDSDSFKNIDFDYQTNLPVLEHVGAFGVKRKHHFHEGVDLYAPEGTVVRAVEDGEIVRVGYFTGPNVNMPWWEETWAVMVEGQTGVVVYGEIIPCSDIVIGPYADSIQPYSEFGPTHFRVRVKAGDPIGTVKRVLKKDKGRPMSMLHLELRTHGTTDWSGWYEETGRPENLLDPTPHLLRTSVNVSRVELLQKLKQNLEVHRKDYQEALVEFHIKKHTMSSIYDGNITSELPKCSSLSL